jgi:hypothetical protein
MPRREKIKISRRAMKPRRLQDQSSGRKSGELVTAATTTIAAATEFRHVNTTAALARRHGENTTTTHKAPTFPQLGILQTGCKRVR